MIIQELESGLQGLKGPVAVDTEFHAEHRYIPKLLLVQLREMKHAFRRLSGTF